MIKCSSCEILKNDKYFGFQSRQCYECKAYKRKQYKAANKTKLKTERYAYNHSFQGRLVALIQAAKQRARKHNLEYSLDREWILNLYEKQNGKCLLTGINFSMENPVETNLNPLSPSLDKIIPKLGYTKDNTRLVCVAINIALNEFGENIFKKVCTAYLKNNKIYI